MMAQWLTSLAQSPRTHVDAGQEWQPVRNSSLRRQRRATRNKPVSQIIQTGKLSARLSILGSLGKGDGQ